MNPQITKEIRVLLPPLAILVLASLLPYRSWEKSWFTVLPVIFIICSAVMAGLSFGHEFQQRTISLLLAQPIPRKRIWLLKTGLLGLFLGLAALAVVLAFRRFDPELLTRSTESFGAALDSMWAPFIGITALAFCTVPLLTCICRSTLLGVVSSFFFAGGLIGMNGLFCEYVLRNRQATVLSAYIVLGLYAVVSLVLGY